jgi:hypothetical protein
MSNQSNFLRQLDFFDPEKDGNVGVEIIGAGGIGSFVALALAKLGINKMRVWDGDKVENHNLPNQLHAIASVGVPKAESIAKVCHDLGEVDIEVKNEFWTPEKAAGLSGIVISAVDSMGRNANRDTDGRKEIWEAVKMNTNVRLFIDCRIGGEFIRILSVRPINDYMKYGWYEKNLFEDKDAAPLPCTAKSIIDVGFMVAAIVTRLVRGYLKNGEVMHDVIASMTDLTLHRMEV